MVQVSGGGQSTKVLQYSFGAFYTERQQLLQSVEEWSVRKDNKNSIPGEVMHLNIITMSTTAFEAHLELRGLTIKLSLLIGCL